ncbi:Uncharacterized protein APZ42_025960 [Daphnia magna]|uniref:Uncharacterized protein n=1 Tax=Daphnia magna TaxID=35525 RepID=A0A164SLK8_9CRUS|nr:Uncharacterized protein APZ42_025960 [Daphnia magna]
MTIEVSPQDKIVWTLCELVEFFFAAVIPIWYLPYDNSLEAVAFWERTSDTYSAFCYRLDGEEVFLLQDRRGSNEDVPSWCNSHPTFSECA